MDLISRINSERKVRKNAGISKFQHSEDPLGDVLKRSWRRPESTSQVRSLNVRLGRLHDVRLRHPDLTSRGLSNRIFRGPPGDVGGGRPRDFLGTNICWDTAHYIMFHYFIIVSLFDVVLFVLLYSCCTFYWCTNLMLHYLMLNYLMLYLLLLFNVT